MRIAWAVGELMVHAMHPYPENRPAFERQRAAYRKQILQPFWSLVAAMGEQTVIAHADAKATGDPPQENGNPKRLPGKVKKCNYRPDMKSRHKKDSQPIHLISIFHAVQIPLCTRIWI
jgi:hypothetical protein